MNKYSIEKSKEVILKPNSEFERRIILQYYLDNNIYVNEIEKDILKNCLVSEHESIGIIGCLLNNNSLLNSLRLVIGSKNTSNSKLSNLSKNLLDIERLRQAISYYFVETDYDNLSKNEKIITTEFNIIS